MAHALRRRPPPPPPPPPPCRPILLLYWFILFFVTMKRQIAHMVKYRYLPFSSGKRVRVSRRAAGPVPRACVLRICLPTLALGCPPPPLPTVLILCPLPLLPPCRPMARMERRPQRATSDGCAAARAAPSLPPLLAAAPATSRCPTSLLCTCPSLLRSSPADLLPLFLLTYCLARAYPLLL